MHFSVSRRGGRGYPPTMRNDKPLSMPEGGCTCFQIRRAARKVTAIYDRHLADVGLTVTQWGLLANLAGKPPTPIGAYAEVMAMDRTTLTRNIKLLLATGLMTLSPGPDRRTRALTLTAEGKAMVRRAYPTWRAAEMEVREALGTKATTALHDTLRTSMALLDAV